MDELIVNGVVGIICVDNRVATLGIDRFVTAWRVDVAFARAGGNYIMAPVGANNQIFPWPAIQNIARPRIPDQLVIACPMRG